MNLPEGFPPPFTPPSSHLLIIPLPPPPSESHKNPRAIEHLLMLLLPLSTQPAHTVAQATMQVVHQTRLNPSHVETSTHNLTLEQNQEE